MENEIFTILDSNALSIGKATRAQAHREGLWHGVVHVWVYDEQYVYFQQRSMQKKDYAGLFDITTAGHIDGDEKAIEAALRECEEEIGMHIDKNRLQFIGIIKEAVFSNKMVDKEIGHVFIYKCDQPKFRIGEEVEGVYKALKTDLMKFSLDKQKGLDIYHLHPTLYGHLEASYFCQHSSAYYQWILEAMD